MRRPPLFVFVLSFAAAFAFGEARWYNVVSRTHVSDLAAEGEAIWVSYLGGGVARYEPRTGRAEYYTAAEGLTHNYATAVALDGDNLYVATRNGLATLPRGGGEFRPTIRTWGFAHNDGTDVAVDERYLYLATLEGARRYDRATTEVTFEPIPPEEGPAARLSPQVEDGWKVFVEPEGVVLDDLYSVTLAEEVVYWGGRGRLFASAPGAAGWREIPIEVPTGAPVRRVLRRGEKLIIATEAGTFEFDGETTAPVPGPLGRVEVREALAFGGLEYYATAEGLFVRRADGEPFKFAAGTGTTWKKLKEARGRKSAGWRVGAADGLPSSRCTALASWGESIVVGTENGACTLEPTSGEIRPLPLASGLPAGGVYAVAYGEGRIWAGTPRGLAAIDAADLAVEKKPLPGGWNDVRDLAFYGGELLLTSRRGVASLRKGGAGPILFDLGEHGLEAEGLRAEKVGGGYFVGTTAGLLALGEDFRLAKTYGAAEGLPTDPVRALLPFKENLLCATLGGGLVALDLEGRDGRVLTAGAGISSDILFSLAADDEHVYVGTYDKGVDVLEEGLRLERNLSWGDGLSHTDIWAAAALPPWLWLSIRGVGINAYNLETGEVRRYYARYGLGDEYCRSIVILPPRGDVTRIAFGTASGVAILEYDGDPPDYAPDDYDRHYP